METQEKGIGGSGENGGSAMIQVENISYSYKTKYQVIHAVREVSCIFEQGMFYAITGESGSGKSTFMALLAGLDKPDQGRILIEGKSLSEMNRDTWRRDMVSVIYQSFNLFPLLNALENVMYPMELKGIKKQEAKERAKSYIRKVGLSEKIYRQYPQMMSGGEQQRVAIARGMAAGGKILLADEPSGNLDSGNERNIVELLKSAAHEQGMCVIVITHNQEVAKAADRILRMKDGRLEEKA